MQAQHGNKDCSCMLFKLTNILKPALPFFALASILGSPTSLGSFWITSRQTTDMTIQVRPEMDRVDLQL